jgi:UDP-2-acetamido-2-deoxy-ribo-hexuluronate aminotransferase
VHRARAHGAGGAYEWTGAGGNYRLDAVQAAVLGVKLEAFGARVARRRAIGERLACAAERAGAVALCGGSGCAPVFSSLALRARGRDRVVARLRERGVDARVQYPRTLPASEAFRSLVAPGARYPEAERATRELLSVPCHPELTDDEVALLESALVEALRDG